MLPDTSRREAKAKTGWEDGPIYTASQDPQVDRREAHFGKSARGAKIDPSEESEGGEGDGKKRCRKREQVSCGTVILAGGLASGLTMGERDAYIFPRVLARPR
jgi:hypothetical protein